MFTGGVYGWSRVLPTTTLPFICEISRAEAFRIDQENRDFGEFHESSLIKINQNSSNDVSFYKFLSTRRGVPIDCLVDVKRCFLIQTHIQIKMLS